MRASLLAALAIFFFACAQSLCGQAAKDSTPAKVVAPPTKPAATKPSGGTNPQLALVRTLVPNTAPTSVSGRAKCDADGNWYLQGADRGFTISKFNAKGEPVATFKATSSPDVAQLDAGGMFTVNEDGEVSQLMFPHSYDRDIFIYKKDGSFKSLVKLDAGGVWSPSLFVVFPSGNFLATGQKWDRPTQQYVPFTGIFSSSGTLLKELHLEDDDNIHEMAARGDSRFVPGPVSGGINHAISRGKIEIGSDGNVYLLRWLNPAVIYAVSPGGEIERRFTVDPGDPELTVGGMTVAGNRIAVAFMKGPPGENIKDWLLEVVDLEGNKVATYEQPVVGGHLAFGLSLACYTHNPEQFTFLGWQEEGEKLVFNITEPR